MNIKTVTVKNFPVDEPIDKWSLFVNAAKKRKKSTATALVEAIELWMKKNGRKI